MNEHPFKTFIELIDFDQDIRSIQKKLQTIASDIQNLELQEKQLQEHLSEAKNQVHSLRKNVDELELELKEYDQQEREKKKHLDTIQNYKEYQSMKAEIDRLKRAQHEGEEVLLDAWNKLEAAQKAFVVQEKEYQEKLEHFQKEITERKKEIVSLENQLEEQKKLRPEKEKKVPEEWLEKYSLMRTRVDDPVVPVLNGSCGSCFYSVSEQDQVRMRKRAVVQCKGCFRLLYMKDVMDQAIEQPGLDKSEE